VTTGTYLINPIRVVRMIRGTRFIPTLAIVTAVALGIACDTPPARDVAETIYRGGTIITLNDAQLAASAITVKKERRSTTLSEWPLFRTHARC
jgi:hypothetical protein